MGSTPAAVPPSSSRPLDDASVVNVQALLRRVAAVDGHPGLSDQLLFDLLDPTGGGVLTLVEVDDGDTSLGGVAVGTQRDGTWTMQVVVDPARRGGSIAESLATRLLASIGDRGGGRVDWWVFAATDVDEQRATRLGLHPDRRLLQMCRPLPIERRPDVATRSFVVGADEAAWLTVNNRAFAGHHEQAGWTIETLRQRTQQPWFDPDDVRVHEREGRLAAFCWTKRHGADVGEIYVIGVDPDFQGLGLGSQLTLAGLEHLASRGATTAMLFVAAENEAARRMYERLGFAVERVDVAFVGELATRAATVTR